MTSRERQRTRERERIALSIARYITQCDHALEDARIRANGHWPDSVTLPLWPGQIERLALVHWMDEVHAKAGKTIRIEFEPTLSRNDINGRAPGPLH
jgi:hypothetical protein